MQSTRAVAQHIWSLCQYLHDDGISTLDYLPQLSLLLFLKMAHERNTSVAGQWSELCRIEEHQLLTHYPRLLNELGNQSGMVRTIFHHAQSKIRRPAILARLIHEIDAVAWTDIEHDVLAEAYESILARTTKDVKSGAGQYFTPGALIQAIVDVTRPEPGERISDPACGTGGFLIEAHKYLLDHYQLTSEQRRDLQFTAFSGGEIVEETARLGLMNLLLHGIGSENSPVSPITIADSLQSAPCEQVDIVYANPPFGQERGGQSVVRYKRQDFCSQTSNKQLNFVQHIVSMLKPYGRAAILVPDNVLFAGGAGEKIRRWLLKTCNVHTLLRLPTGIFYAQGVKANVLFFQKGQPQFNPWTTQLWVYDLRTDTHYTLRNHPLTRTDLDDFVQSYHAEDLTQREESNRFQCFSYNDLIKQEKYNLDLFWVRKKVDRTEEKHERGKVVKQEAPLDPKRAEEAMQAFRKMFPKGSRIYISIASETPLLVKFYAAHGSSIISLDQMLARCIPTFRLVRSRLVSGLFAPDRGILHDDADTVLFLVDAIGRHVWQDSNAYRRDWLPE